MKFMRASWLTGPAHRVLGYLDIYRHDQTKLICRLPAFSLVEDCSGQAEVRVSGRPVQVDDSWSISMTGNTARKEGHFAVRVDTGKWYLAA